MNIVNEVVAIIVKDNEVFITQRDYGNFNGMWEFPCGVIELGEAPEMSLIKRIKKAFSATIKVEEWMDTAEYDYATTHLVIHAYVCSISTGELTLSNHENAKWITLEEFKNINWNPANKRLVSILSWRLRQGSEYMRYKKLQNGDLYSYIDNDIKTLDLMDKFEGIEQFKSEGAYKRLIFQNAQKDTVGDYLCTYHLIMERCHNQKYTTGNITFSEFRKNKGKPVYDYCRTQLCEALKQNKRILESEEFYFYKPFYLRAQNSNNRKGYGWEWDWSGGVGTASEGTFYGETSNYAFVGVKIGSVEKKNKPVCVSKAPPLYLRIEKTIHYGRQYFKIYKNTRESFLIPCDTDMTKEKAIELFKSYLQNEKKEH